VSPQFLHSLLAYATIFPHRPKTRCRASSAKLQGEGSQEPPSVCPDTKLPGHVCPRTSLPRAALTQVSPDARSWRSDHPSQTHTCTYSWARRSQERCPPLPPAVAKSIPQVYCPGHYHPRSIRDAQAHPPLWTTSGCAASSQLCLPVPPPAPRRGTLTG